MIKVRNQLFLNVSFILSLLFFGIVREVEADDFYKNAALTCDEKNNIAMVRFNAGYKKIPPSAKLSTDLASKYGYLNERPIQKSCKFKDGRHIILADGMGQSLPYGWCGGDASAYFSLKIDNKYIFYKKGWNWGRCVYSYDPLLLILDNKKLISCKSNKDSKIFDLENYLIQDDDCEDISVRLTSDLPEAEESPFLVDQKVDEYKEISKDKGICSYFSQIENLKPFFGNRGFVDLAKRTYPVTREITNIGSLSKASSDINGDGKNENIYKLENRVRVFDGSFLFYFLDSEDDKSFIQCALEGKCSEKIEADFKSDNPGSQRILNFLMDANIEWPSFNIINAGKSNDFSNTSADTLFSYTYLISYKDVSYVYSELSDAQGKAPASVIMQIKPDNRVETLCTFRELPKW